MFNLLHSYQPENIRISIGPINVYWYGLFIVLGMLAGMIVAMKLAGYYNVSKDMLIDLIFWLIIGGVAGARIYDVLIEFGYYRENPLDIFKIWQGGLAIHGAIIAGFLITYYFTKRYGLDFWRIGSIIAPGLALGQAIGRWGNYFNQELFGLPTTLPWGIPIRTLNRPMEYFSSQYFHPTFLYESLGSLAIFIFLILWHRSMIRNKYESHKKLFLGYLIFYSLLRFSLEFIRADSTPVLLGLRLPQIASLAIIIFSIILLRAGNKRPDAGGGSEALEKQL